MIAVLSDTHGHEDPHLAGAARDAVERASAVVHAGDFTTGAVLDAFEAAAERLVAVSGNADAPAVRERLPATTTATVAGVRVAVAHGHEHAETGLSMLGRQADADVVVFGHSHRPTVVDAGDGVLLNPGSHADPRGGVPTHAELEHVDGRLEGRVVARDGSVLESFVG